MDAKVFRLISLDESDVRQSQNNANLRLVCLIEGGGKLAVWGSPGSVANIEKVRSAGLPCKVECECIPAREPWASKYDHRYWVPEGRSLRVPPG